MFNGNILFKVNGNPLYIYFCYSKFCILSRKYAGFPTKISKSIHREIMLEDDYRGASYVIWISADQGQKGDFPHS
jgi:hypothetical protein